MPVMPSWVDYLPDGEQARDAGDLAVGKAKSGAIRLAALPLADAASALEDAAAEAARFSLLLGPSRTSIVTQPYHATLHRVLPELDPEKHGRRAIGGAIAFTNVILSHGGYVEGHFDRSTRVGLGREVAWLEAIANQQKHDRLLAFAALAHEKVELARMLSSDDRVLAIAEALEHSTATPFHDLVTTFHDTDLGYAELMLVARAYVVAIEERGAGGIGAAADWLHRLVHEGTSASPAPRVSERQPPKKDPALVARATSLFGASPPERVEVGWNTITLEDVHGLFGGVSITISRYGHVHAVDVQRGQHARRFTTRLSTPGLTEIAELVEKHDLAKITTSSRMGVAGEARPTLTLTTSSETCIVAKWANDRHPSFDALYNWLRDAATALAETAVPDAVGKWTSRFEPT